MFTINYRDRRAVYEQIVDEIQKMIIFGALAPDEQLPSVREMAQQLAINPNTIQRAYRELEHSGYIYSVAGKGNFAGVWQDVDERRKDKLLQTLQDTLTELRFLGVSEETLRAAFAGTEKAKPNEDGDKGGTDA